jgi:hypothetical protein
MTVLLLLRLYDPRPATDGWGLEIARRDWVGLEPVGIRIIQIFEMWQERRNGCTNPKTDFVLAVVDELFIVPFYSSI